MLDAALMKAETALRTALAESRREAETTMLLDDAADPDEVEQQLALMDVENDAVMQAAWITLRADLSVWLTGEIVH